MHFVLWQELMMPLKITYKACGSFTTKEIIKLKTNFTNGCKYGRLSMWDACFFVYYFMDRKSNGNEERKLNQI